MEFRCLTGAHWLTRGSRVSDLDLERGDGIFLSRPRVPELQRLHHRHHTWRVVGQIKVAGPTGARLIWSGCGTSLRMNGLTSVPAVVVVRSVVDRDSREHLYRTAARDAGPPALSHVAILPTSHRYIPPGLEAEQNRTGVTFVEDDARHRERRERTLTGEWRAYFKASPDVRAGAVAKMPWRAVQMAAWSAVKRSGDERWLWPTTRRSTPTSSPLTTSVARRKHLS